MAHVATDPLCVSSGNSAATTQFVHSGGSGSADCAGAVADKRGGRKLGTAGSADTAAHARAARTERANRANATTRTVIAEIRRAGHTTLAAIAAELQACGVRTPAGRSTWQPVQVSRLLAA